MKGERIEKLLMEVPDPSPGLTRKEKPEIFSVLLSTSLSYFSFECLRLLCPDSNLRWCVCRTIQSGI
jgi:hypothetical protein